MSRPKRCSACGKDFSCGPGTGKDAEHCWCEELPHDLPFTGDDCLCEACARNELARLKASRDKVVMSWSGGKDSALALHALRKSGAYDVVSLLTTVTDEYDRIAMHGVRRELLERQAEELGLPLHKVAIPKVCVNEVYERKMAEAVEAFKRRGVTKFAFGDLFLEDLKKYRDERLEKAGVKGVYPIWKRDTAGLVREFIALGFKAILCCVDTKALAPEFAGREIDESLLRDLPPGVDPCGENGEFHSFVYDGPIFKKRISCKLGERVRREERFEYRDILPT